MVALKCLCQVAPRFQPVKHTLPGMDPASTLHSLINRWPITFIYLLNLHRSSSNLNFTFWGHRVVLTITVKSQSLIFCDVQFVGLVLLRSKFWSIVAHAWQMSFGYRKNTDSSQEIRGTAAFCKTRTWCVWWLSSYREWFTWSETWEKWNPLLCECDASEKRCQFSLITEHI